MVNTSSFVAYHKLAVGIFLFFNENRDLVARFQLWVVPEFRCADNTLRLVANVDHHFLLANRNDRSFNDFLLLDQGQTRLVQIFEPLALVRAVFILLTFKSIPIKFTCGLGQLTRLSGCFFFHILGIRSFLTIRRCQIILRRMLFSI